MSAGRSGCISVDGRLFAPHEAVVSALDAGFLLGDGLFESLRATGAVPYLLDRHLSRLLAAAQELEFANMPSPDELVEQVRRTLERADIEDAYLRITVTRGRGATALSPPAGPPTVVVAALPAPPRPPADAGVEAKLIGPPAERGPRAKSTSRQAAVIARRRVDRARAGEGLYVSQEGHVLEGVSSNVFAIQAERLLTPPARDCLPGVTRGRLLELAREAGIGVLEAPLPVESLLSADGAFVTNAVQGPRAVRAIEGSEIGASAGGTVFAGLLALYESDRAADRAAAEHLRDAAVS